MRRNLGFDESFLDRFFDVGLYEITDTYDNDVLDFFDRYKAETEKPWPSEDFRSSLFFLEENEKLDAQLEELQNKCNYKYLNYKENQYFTCKTQCTKSCLFSKQTESHDNIAKCRLQRSADLFETRITGVAFANQLKPYFYQFLYRKPRLITEIISLIDGLNDRAGANGVYFIERFMEKIDFLDSALLCEAFDAVADEVETELEPRIKRYENSPLAFVTPSCQLCHFATNDALEREISLWVIRGDGRPTSHFFYFLLNRNFFRSLKRFLQKIKTEDIWL